MSDRVTEGPLYCRPYGGTMVLVRNELHEVTKCVFCSERYVVVKVGNLLIVNVYLPCTGTSARM